MENILADAEKVQLELIPFDSDNGYQYELEGILFDLNKQVNFLSSHADGLDCLVAIASGVLCGLLDVLWVGEFNLEHGREIASDKVENFVKGAAKTLGWKDNGEINSAVEFLEKIAPIPSDGNTFDFGGGLNHHLRDFAHHPTIVGLIFSLLTQFTGKAYGTDVNGAFKIVDVPQKSLKFIGKDAFEKIFYGSIIWFFHLVSDIAGSSSTAGLSGGTGIPGPVLTLAKEISAIPVFRQMKVKDIPLIEFISKLFDGTYFAKRDEKGRIIKESIVKIDFRGEIGAGVELSKQAMPVIANESIVQTFYFIRRFSMELKNIEPQTISDIKMIEWGTVWPANNPTISRMLTISTAVFTTLDVADAAVSKKLLLSVNYVGIGRFTMALDSDINWQLKKRQVQAVRAVYERIKQNTYLRSDDEIYVRMGNDLYADRLALTKEQVEILYNIEYHKVLNDIFVTKFPVRDVAIKELKSAWLDEWKAYMTSGFSSFLNLPGAQLHWYDEDELFQKISECGAYDTWFRLVLLEAMLFEPYYPLALEKNKKGTDVPSKKYKDLQIVGCGYNRTEGDRFLTEKFTGVYCTQDFITRLRKCYGKCVRELNEVLKGAIKTLSITAGITIFAVATAGAFAPAIATLLVESNFAGLSGAALTSACLAYVGGGAIAAGGAGMAGGTIAIVGGGAILGLGVGAGVGGAVGLAGINGKQGTIMQSAKLMTATREIFLNDEHDMEYSDTVYEQYVAQIAEIEKALVELRLEADVVAGQEKKKLTAQIKQAEESVEAMKIARTSMLRFNSAFAEGMKSM